ncbi:hypothetical protein LZ32DRAFT_79926 [Colletotrichum eremochloae]|nr:hypothetical protein LZ32DRAFT_79926 [Colletotrichum eremochloae]
MHIIFIFPVHCKWTSISLRSDTGGWISPISALPRELSCLGSLKLARRFCKIDDILMRYLQNNTSKSCPFRIRPMNFDGVVGVRFQVPATARRGSGKEGGGTEKYIRRPLQRRTPKLEPTKRAFSIPGNAILCPSKLQNGMQSSTCVRGMTRPISTWDAESCKGGVGFSLEPSGSHDLILPRVLVLSVKT